MNIKKLLAGLMIAVCIVGCTTSQQVTAYQSLAATEAAVTGAYNGYLDSVVTGQTPTNSVPQISAEYNDTQLAIHAAAVIASGGMSSPTPAAVQVKANNFQSHVTVQKGH